MRRFGSFILLVLVFGISQVFAQQLKKIEGLYGPEGLNMPGSYNGYTNPPATGSVFGGIESSGKLLVDNGLGTGRYKTTINVQASGGDIVAGTYTWLFTSGPTGSPWGNKWAGTTVGFDQVQGYTYNSGSDNSVTVANGYYYTVVFQDNGYTGSNAAWLKTSAAPVTITSVTGFPSSIAMNTAVTCSVQVSATPSAEEKIYIRYSTDNFAANFQSVQVTGIDPVTHIGTATIPGQTSNGITISFYAFSTTVASASWGSQNVDLLTLNYKKNGASNFSYNIAPITSIAAGNWSSTSTWNTGIVPPASSTVFINTAVTLDADVTLSAVTVESAGSFSINTGKTLTIATNGSLTNSGTFNVSSGTLAFAGLGTLTNSGTFDGGSGAVNFTGAATLTNTGTFTGNTGTVTFSNTATVSGTVGFYNVNLANGGDFGTASTVNGLLTLNSGGYINNNHPPIYASTSTLKYNTGGTYGRWLEWSATSGAGYPANLQISNNTIVDLGNGGTAVARQISGNLTIDAGSRLTMDSSANPMTASLSVRGNVTINGTLNLSSLVGGDLNVGKNLTVNNIFNCDGRAVQFNGSTPQTIGGTAAIVIDYLTINSTGGVSLAKDLTINSLVTMTSGTLDLNGKTLTLGTTASISESAGNVIKGTAGTITTTRTLGTGSLGNVAGLGAEITVGSALGVTTITRGHTVQTGNSQNSINRYFDISPATNTGLNATLVFHYDNTELNGITASNLTFFRSTDSGTSWTLIFGGVQSSGTGVGTVTLNGINSFSRWTLGDKNNPLPVELASFNASTNQNGVQLNWVTASEVNNFGFFVQRSTDSFKWENVSFVKAAANGNAAKEYSFTDNIKKDGKYFYRLKQRDNDGSEKTFDAVEVTVKMDWSYQLNQNYPNPFNPSTKISYTIMKPGMVKLTVFNAIGQMVKSYANNYAEAGTYSVDFNAHDLPSGLYFFKMEAGNYTATRKMLLVK